MLVCRNCRTQMSENIKFCTVCGTKLMLNHHLEPPKIVQELSKRMRGSIILYRIGGVWIICMSILTAAADDFQGKGSLILYVMMGLFSFLVASMAKEEKERILKDYSGIVGKDENSIGDVEFSWGLVMAIVVIGGSVFLYLFGGWTSISIMFSVVFYLIDFGRINSYVKNHKSEFLALEQRQNEESSIVFCNNCGSECTVEDDFCSECGSKVGEIKNEM